MSAEQGINYRDIKTQNRALIFKLISTGKCSSRVELAKESGLTKMSVSNIVSDFIDMGIVMESHTGTSHGVGRCPIILDIAEDGPKVVGLHIGREYCSVALCDLKLNNYKTIYKKLEIYTKEGLIDLITKLVDDILENEENVLAIGVGSIGPLDLERGIILNPPNFYGITNIHIVDILKSRYDIPVFMESEYNNAALAEKYYGDGKDIDDFIFLGITNGIGSGVILNGSLMKNSSLLSSELGHVSIDFNGNYCDCGNRGCIETYASATVIHNRLKLETGLDISFKEFCERAEDSKIDRILLEMMEYLSYGLISSINMFNPQVIMLGDRGVSLPDKYLQYLEMKINHYKLSKSYNYVKIVKPKFGEMAELAGSAVCVLEQIFKGNLLVNNSKI